MVMSSSRSMPKVLFGVGNSSIFANLPGQIVINAGYLPAAVHIRSFGDAAEIPRVSYGNKSFFQNPHQQPRLLYDD